LRGGVGGEKKKREKGIVAQKGHRTDPYRKKAPSKGLASKK